MRKLLLSALLIGALLVMGLGAVAAQDDRTPLELGEWVEGELTNNDYELKYTFEGKEGDIVLVEMQPKPGTYDLDPYIVLRDSDGDVLGQNDDFGYPLSVVVAELQADEQYVVLATRSGGSTGSSEGEFWLRVTVVDLVESGSELEATISSVSEEDIPAVFVMRPEERGEYTITFSQEVSELYAALRLSPWVDDSYESSLLSLESTAGVSEASFTVELDGGQFYILRVSRAFGSFVFDEMENTVKIGVE